MGNSEIAEIFYKIADMMEIKNIAWKPVAYRNAARQIESLSKSVEEIYRDGGLKALLQIPAIGKAVAKKIEEYIETRKIKEFEDLKKAMPMDYEELGRVEGLGPKKISLIYSKLKIKNIAELESAAKKGKLAKISGMGERTQENILKSIEFAKKSGNRRLLGDALEISEELVLKLKKLSGVQKIQICGSLARKKETIGDIDILIITKKPEDAISYFARIGERVIVKGSTKATIVYNEMDVDLRVISPESFGSAVQYFVGSKEHNVALRKIAISKGFKLSEYGLFMGKNKIAGKNEKEIYSKLGLRWVPYELRENRGEIEAAKNNKIPRLIETKDILCDLQMHTNYSDGKNTITEMAEACQKKGLEYMAVTDHVGHLAIAGAMDAKKIEKQRKEIDKINSGFKKFTVLHGAEVDVKANGSLAADKKVLDKLDLVLASIHSGMKRSKEEQTRRIVSVIESQKVHIIAHPTGRLINERQGYELDWEKIFESAKKNNVAIEINAYPKRLDLNDINARAARNAGVKLSIGTDSHAVEQLKNLKLGVFVARRAWCEKKDIINTMKLAQFKRWMKR